MSNRQKRRQRERSAGNRALVDQPAAVPVQRRPYMTREEQRAAAPPAAPALTPLDVVAQVPAYLAGVERQVVEAIARARAAGESWASIGAALGVTKQTAHERYAAAVRSWSAAS